MFTKTVILFSAVAVVTLLKVQAEHLMERDEKCTKILSQECAGSADVVPFAYPPEPKGIDDACSAASTYFPCFKKFASTCDTDDVESRYFLTYLEICDSSNTLYDGVRKSIRCMKLAEKRYNETCIKPNEKVVAELAAFGNKINDFDISAEDWKKIEFGLIVLQEEVCFLQVADECNEEFVPTMETLFERFGAKKVTSVLLEKQAIVEKVLDNLNLEDTQKAKLKKNLG